MATGTAANNGDPSRRSTPTVQGPHGLEADVDLGILGAGPGVVRIALGTGWRVTTWAVGTTVRGWSRVLRAAADGESVTSLMAEITTEAVEQARDVLGLQDAPRLIPRPRSADAPPSAGALRRRGEALLYASTDVEYREEAHPAYARILDDLAPDEARILRLLAVDGSQPSVDVRRASLIHDELIAPGLTMIGNHAGCRYMDRVPSYLNNLYRLGLVWFSREPLADPLGYQVLEAQPDVAHAMAEAKRSKTVRRSIHLTPFGHDFVRVCLPVDPAPDPAS